MRQRLLWLLIFAAALCIVVPLAVAGDPNY